jgi:hypothetical protein
LASLTVSDDDHGEVRWRIIEACAQLAIMRPNNDGSRTVRLGRFGGAEVHLTELPADRRRPAIPPLWIEAFSSETGITIDGLGCFAFDEDNLACAVEMILDARGHSRILSWKA